MSLAAEDVKCESGIADFTLSCIDAEKTNRNLIRGKSATLMEAVDVKPEGAGYPQWIE